MDNFNTRQKLALLCMDILLLVELTLCVYFSHQDKANMPYLFLRSYVPLCLGTFFLFRLVIRKLQTPATELRNDPL